MDKLKKLAERWSNFWKTVWVDYSILINLDKNNKLKGCPFCGKRVEVKFNWGSRPDKTKEYSMYGHKKSCFLSGFARIICYSDRQQLINEWNTRVSEEGR